jgi:hypothetical protein
MDLKKQGSLRGRWADREKAGQPTPVRGLRGLHRDYCDARLSLKDQADGDQLRKKQIIELNGALMRALGFPAEPRTLEIERAGEAFAVPVAHASHGVLALDCEWAADTDAAFDADGPGRLLTPVETGSRETIWTGAKLARWLFAAGEPPQYVLLRHGGVIVHEREMKQAHSLLFVAATRSRDSLMISCHGRPSPFLPALPPP